MTGELCGKRGGEPLFGGCLLISIDENTDEGRRLDVVVIFRREGSAGNCCYKIEVFLVERIVVQLDPFELVL